VLEFLASSKPAGSFPVKNWRNEDAVLTMTFLLSLAHQCSITHTLLPQGYAGTLLRLAIVNGNDSIVRLILSSTRGGSPQALTILGSEVRRFEDGRTSPAEVITGVAYEDVLRPVCQGRSPDEIRALSQLSDEGLATTLRKTFQLEAVWDDEVLALVFTKYFQREDDQFANGSILRHMLYNAATFLGTPLERTSAPGLLRAIGIIDVYVAAGRRVKASIGTPAWRQMLNKVATELALAVPSTDRRKEIKSFMATNKLRFTLSAADMRKLLSDVVLFYRHEVDKAPVETAQNR
jgi:hypothetical protein